MRVLVIAPGKKNCKDIADYTIQLVSNLRKIYSANSDDSISHIEVSPLDYLIDKQRDNAIVKEDLNTYIETAGYINQNYEVCLLQHHPNGFGGLHGNYILALTSHLTIPLITTFHSVNSNPSEEEKTLYQTIASFSNRVMAFSNLAIEFLEHYYKLSREKIVRTEHALQDFVEITNEELCDNLGLANKKVISSAGKMIRSYGFETVINALPSLLSHYPDIVYVIIDTGDDNSENKYYKKSLQRLAQQRGVADHVLIKSINSIKEQLESLLNASDVYISSQANEKELDNAMLSKAVSSGAAVLSTPSWFAKELLEDQKGVFYSFESSNDLTNNLLKLLRNKKEWQLVRDNAMLYGEQNTWPIIGKRILETLRESARQPQKNTLPIYSVKPLLLPDINFTHLNELTDATGVLNQSVYNVLDYNRGYDLKNNAIALHAYSYAYVHTKDKRWLKGINTCLGFISSMYDEKQGWSARMSYDRQKQNESSEIAESRAIWSLGYLYATTNCNGTRDYAYSLLNKLLNPNFKDIKAKAYAVLGISRVLKYDGTNTKMLDLLEQWTQDMYSCYPTDIYNVWQWHEEKIRSEMALIPLALSFSSEILKNKDYLSASKRALRFLQKIVFAERVYSPSAIGIQKDSIDMDEKTAKKASETYLMTTAYSRLYHITKEPKYLKTISETHNWFFGDNSIGKSLYDSSNGGCYDCISGRSISPEQTAESTCAYWLSHFALLEAYFGEISYYNL